MTEFFSKLFLHSSVFNLQLQLLISNKLHNFLEKDVYYVMMNLK